MIRKNDITALYEIKEAYIDPKTLEKLCDVNNKSQRQLIIDTFGKFQKIIIELDYQSDNYDNAFELISYWKPFIPNLEVILNINDIHIADKIIDHNNFIITVNIKGDVNEIGEKIFSNCCSLKVVNFSFLQDQKY